MTCRSLLPLVGFLSMTMAGCSVFIEEVKREALEEIENVRVGLEAKSQEFIDEANRRLENGESGNALIQTLMGALTLAGATALGFVRKKQKQDVAQVREDVVAELARKTNA